MPFDTGDPANDDQVNGLIDFAEDTYDLFSNLSGGSYLSWDGVDGTMYTVWLATNLPCPNASWNGQTVNFCDGVASDDVTAHEWVHGYTEATHGLIYQWQPGALNEAYSDIFGETIDLLNGAGTDTPTLARTTAGCSTFGGSPPPTFEISSPALIAGDYLAAGAAFNPPPPLSVSAQIEQVDDGDDEGGGASVTDACQSLDGFTSGRIALIDRGDCSFVSKVKRAQNAGASGAIVVNYNDSAFNMGGNDPTITIPAVMVGSSDGQLIRDQLASGVMATISIDASTDASLRWLQGEDSFAFGGAIRDLWNPVCYGDPGRVTDARYHCATSDGGGVHTNSGVPNHGFALLVDGGGYNGFLIGGLGLTKAAHLYWRAMSVYQVPDSGFADHADALEQSCLDLVGIDLADPLTGAASGQSLDAQDCATVAQAMLAVEMADPPDCNFQPLLDPNTPPLECGALAFGDDFESDPGSRWTLSNSGVFEEYSPRDWQWTSDVPEGGTGSAFFAIDSFNIGNCIEGDDDQSGMMRLESEAIVLGGDATAFFDHWIASEYFYDGGNVKVAVNDGPFTLIASDDFTLNSYNATLVTTEDGNTNPMAGERAFTGSDGGEVTGSWGQSRIDLSPYAGAGDTIRIRFDFGVDGCNGLDGWYVDNVRVCTSETGAGSVPDGTAIPGTQLRLNRVGTEVELTWGGSCVAGDSDYEIYEGALGDFASHVSRFCTTSGATTRTFEPVPGSSYYLVVPHNTSREGSYGTDSSGAERPQGGAACLAQALSNGCD